MLLHSKHINEKISRLILLPKMNVLILNENNFCMSCLTNFQSIIRQYVLLEFLVEKLLLSIVVFLYCRKSSCAFFQNDLVDRVFVFLNLSVGTVVIF